METNNPITTVDPNQGQALSVAGNNYRILVSGEQTQDNYAVIDMLVPPGGGPGPHAHPHMQESFYVVEGEVEFSTRAGSYTAKQGAFVDIPLGGEVHSFKNNSKEPAHLLCTVIPAGLKAFFREVGKPVAEGRFLPPPDFSPEELQQMIRTAEKYGQQLYLPDYSE